MRQKLENRRRNVIVLDKAPKGKILCEIRTTAADSAISYALQLTLEQKEYTVENFLERLRIYDPFVIQEEVVQVREISRGIKKGGR